MARGLLTGSIIVSIVSLICSTFAALFPGWLVDRKVRESSFCWVGDGIWTIEYGWGSDIEPFGFDCSSSSPHKGPYSSHEAYCENAISEYGEPDNYNQDMCSRTNLAKVFSIIDLLCIFISLVCMVIGMLSRNKEFLMACISTIASMISLIAHLGCFVSMVTSPLFSNGHIDFISSQHHGPPLRGIDCSFESPLTNMPYSILDSSSLNCLFPGPAFIASFAGIITITFSCVLQVLWAIDSFKLSHPTMIQYAKKDLVDHPETHSRIYSLYGASSRRADSLPAWRRHMIVTVIPTLLLVAVTCTWAVFVITGVQVVLHARIRIVPYDFIKEITNPDVIQSTNDFQSILSKYQRDSLPYSTFQNQSIFTHDRIHDLKYQEIQDVIFHAITESLKNLSQIDDESLPFSSILLDNELDARRNKKPRTMTLFLNTYNLFDFNPFTMVTFFIQNNAYLIAIAIAGSMLLWPPAITTLVLWFYWVPSSEVFRGRIISWADALGKAQLALFYTLVSLGLVDDIFRFIYLPWFLFAGFLRKGEALELGLFVRISDGLGSYSFVLLCIGYLILGNMSLRLHRYAKGWEENRRATLAKEEMNRIIGLESETFGTEQPHPLDGIVDEEDLDEEYQNIQKAAEMLKEKYGNRDTPFIDSLAWSGAIPSLFNKSKRASAAIGDSSTPLISRLTPPLGQNTPTLFGSGNRIRSGNLGRNPFDNLFMKRQSILGTTITNGTAISPASVANSGSNQIMVVGEGGKLIHPESEALCDRVFYPLPGRRMRWSSFGKTIMYLIIFFAISATMITLSIDIIQINFEGFVGDFIVAPNEKKKRFSILSIATQLINTSFPGKSYHLAGFYFFFTVVMNVLHVIGLELMWAVPMSLERQRTVFHMLELFSAWSAVDVFCGMLIIFSWEIRRLPNGLFNLTVPNISKLIEIIFPFETGLLHVSIDLTDDFVALIIVVIAEKILSFFILELAAQMISERDVLERYSDGRLLWNHGSMDSETSTNALSLDAAYSVMSNSSQNVNQHQAKPNPKQAHVKGDILYQAFSPLLYMSLEKEQEMRESSSASDDNVHAPPVSDSTPTAAHQSVELNASGQQQTDPSNAHDEHNEFRIGAPRSAIVFDDLTEQLFETEVGALFSPAARYASAYMPKIMYAGFPRKFWAFGEKLGIFEAVVIVDQSNSAIDPTIANSGQFILE